MWGLESISDDTQGWQSYNEGLPNVRVDMFQLRAEDRTIALATHGRGVFMGTFNQGAPDFVPLSTTEISETTNELLIYPNPTQGEINFNSDIRSANVFSNSGRLIYSSAIENQKLDLSSFDAGIYIIQAKDVNGSIRSTKLVKK